MAADLIKLSLPPNPTFRTLTRRRSFSHTDLHRRRFSEISTFTTPTRRARSLIVSKAVEFRAPIDRSEPEEQRNQAVAANEYSSVLLDVSGMMCGGCVSRVKGILTADDRVESAVVNMLTETAAVKLKPVDAAEEVAESLATRLTECGFEAKRRVAGSGVGERVEK